MRNDFQDILDIPDFSRKIYLVKKAKNGKNDWYELDDKDFYKYNNRNGWIKFCDKHKFFAWSYSPYGIGR